MTDLVSIPMGEALKVVGGFIAISLLSFALLWPHEVRIRRPYSKRGLRR